MTFVTHCTLYYASLYPLKLNSLELKKASFSEKLLTAKSEWHLAWRQLNEAIKGIKLNFPRQIP